MALFTGSGVAVVTPFNKDKSVDYNALEKLIDFHLKNKTDALIVCGTTGESSTLTDEERIEITRFAVKAVNKKIPVIAGAGSNNTRHAAELSVKCRDVGADGILSVTPYYNKTTQKGLVVHFTQIAEAVGIPVIMYNVPSRTGLNLLPETVAQLSKVKYIDALKDASGNITQSAHTLRLVGDDFTVYSGNDDQVVPIMSLGGKGVISTIANIMPKDVHDMVYEFLGGNMKKASEMQLSQLPLIDALFCEVNPIPVKTALSLMGFCGGVFREPLCEMGEKNLETLKKEMTEAGLL